jgi:uncharacterized membrane protein
MKKLVFLFLLLSGTSQLTANLKIDGEFMGWNGETIVKLTDGSTWIQSDYSYKKHCDLYRPNVQLLHDNGLIKMLVDGCGSNAVPVMQLTNVIDSITKSDFKGFDNDSIIDFRVNKISLIRLPESYSSTVAVYSSTPSTFLTVQNNTPYTIFFCYALDSDASGWVSHGWYEVESYSSNSKSLGSYSGTVYMYAEHNHGEHYWGDSNSPYSFCVDNSCCFRIMHSECIDCDIYDTRKVKMRKFDVPQDGFTWTINP